MVPFAPCDKKNEEIPNPASPTRTAKVDSGPTASTLPDRPLVGLCRGAAFSSHRKASARLRRKSEGVGLAAFGALSPARTSDVDAGRWPSPLRGRPPVGLCRGAALSSHRQVSTRLRRKSEGVGLAASGALSPARTSFSSHRKVSTRLRRKSEGVGFEPTDPCGSPVFKTGAIDRSTTPPELDSLAELTAAGKRWNMRIPRSFLNAQILWGQLIMANSQQAFSARIAVRNQECGSSPEAEILGAYCSREAPVRFTS